MVVDTTVAVVTVVVASSVVVTEMVAETVVVTMVMAVATTVMIIRRVTVHQTTNARTSHSQLKTKINNKKAVDMKICQ